MELTDEHRELLRRTLDGGGWTFGRNHYVAYPANDAWPALCDLAQAGFMTRHLDPLSSGTLFRVADEGRAALASVMHRQAQGACAVRANLPAVDVFGPLRAFVARCRTGPLLVTGLTIEHGWVLHPLISAGDVGPVLGPGWTISEPATGFRIAFGCTIAATRAQLAVRIEEMGGIARFLVEVDKARAAILGSLKASSC